MPTKNKALQKKWRDEWYQRNKAKQINRQLERRRELFALLKRYKRFLSCIDCGMSFRDRPECCDFHHLDPSLKEDAVGKMLASSKGKLKEELRKCVPLCANCHRTRHANTGVAQSVE